MAPRTAKSKKNADVKVTENEAPRKGRGKAKTVVDPDQESVEVDEKVAIVEKKNKRGKIAASDNNEESAISKEELPAKKGRKKNVEKSVTDTNKNGEDSDKDVETAVDEDTDDKPNGHSEEIQVPAKGRKKGAKKEAVKEVKPKENTKGKKNSKQEPEKEEVTEEKPKGRGRGRKAQPKPELEPEENIEEEEEKPAKGKKGRGKGQEKVPEQKVQDDEMDVDDAIQDDEEDEEVEEEPKKKEVKGRKTAKKVQPKEESDRNEDIKEAPAAKKRKGGKKDEKGKGDEGKEELEKDEVAETKPTKGKRGQKKTEKSEANEVQDTGEPTTKRRRKADEKAADDDKKKPTKSGTDYDSIDFTNSSTNSQGKEWNFKIASWNVDGIRAWMAKEGLDYLKYEKPDILCVQEIKCSQEKLPEDIKNIPGYHAYWLSSEKDGYAGVGIYTTKLAINVQYGLQNEELDADGRIITAEYEQFYLICTYVPNAGRKLVTLPKRLKWNEEFRKHVKSLDKNKPVIICGDMNVAHNEIDLTNPKTNKKNAGFTDEERSGMTEFLGDGFVDTYRHFYPDKTGAYTFWSNMFNSRAKNVGWRLDYFIVSERLIPVICDNVIRDKVYGSDHCPISLFLHLTNADKPKEL